MLPSSLIAVVAIVAYSFIIIITIVVVVVGIVVIFVNLFLSLCNERKKIMHAIFWGLLELSSQANS